ncbi:unnamed protein product [Brassicogethes aeneus]|uniref:Ras-GEF domain-containing protein n=1 Tax=Brassicogethes aeneus TaxID=1431903 RepID=A0A9P0BA70_BRAAE|nr:unnamed protein product [Brassicogethes aeneus]
MSDCRVQKLLFSEFCDFDDMVLLESPFAQTTKDGTGIRQVHLGLTTSKLVLATDILPPVDENFVSYVPGIDPEIETFELIAIYPVTCVNLSVYRRKRRQALKARFCNNKVLYFELGGFQRRRMFWNLWCEKIKFLSPNNSNSSKSETSVATSTTGSTLYVVEKKLVSMKGTKQLWCKFGSGDSPGIDHSLLDAVYGNNRQKSSMFVSKWTDKYLYMGDQFQDYALDYRPQMHPTTFDDVVYTRKDHKVKTGRRSKDSDTLLQISSICDMNLLDYTNLNAPVELWEKNKNDKYRKKSRHKRRYGFSPQPLFLHGLGPWTVNPGSYCSLQLKRASSEVQIRQPLIDPRLRLPISKRHLVTSISCTQLYQERIENSRMSSPTKPIIYFWTPDYWYRPWKMREAYLDMRKHLKLLSEYIEGTCKTKPPKKKRIFRKFYSKGNHAKDSDDDDDDSVGNTSKTSKKCRSKKRKAHLSGGGDSNCEPYRLTTENSLQYVKRLLKIDIAVNIWDFDSTTLAEQLTMIDRDLFLKITPDELGIIIWKQNTKFAPNVSALLAFSHRISCLIAHEILKDNMEKIRARLISRFINVADKCHKMSNFQSCKTILCGLQSPAIYRLRDTWAYLRKKHATRYHLFQYLSKLYRDPRLLGYQKIFLIFSQKTPFLPYIGHIIEKLLDRIPNYEISMFRKRSKSLTTSSMQTNSKTESSRSKSLDSIRSKHEGNIVTKLINSFKLFNMHPPKPHKKSKKKSLSIKKQKSFEPPKNKYAFRCLDDYYKPISLIEDNRLKCLEEVTEFLERCQIGAMNYNFDVHDMARCYLLKARYKEDRDNFMLSLVLEPVNCIVSQ